jgi:WD40 repeat protein
VGRQSLLRFVPLALAWVPALCAADKSSAPPAITPSGAHLEWSLGNLGGPGFAVSYSPQTGILAAGCELGTIGLWNKDIAEGIRDGGEPSNLIRAHQGPVLALACVGSYLVSAGVDQQVILWNLPDGTMFHALRAPGVVRALAVSSDGKHLAAGGDDGTTQLWDLSRLNSPTATGPSPVPLTGLGDSILCMGFTSDGKLLAAGGYAGIVRLWDVDTRKKLSDIAYRPPVPSTPAPAVAVLSLAFSPDNKLLALGGSDGAIQLVNATGGKMVRSLTGHDSSVTCLAFHPSGNLLASGSRDRTIRLWNPDGGRAVKALEGHTAWVQGLTYSANGTRLASVGADRTVRLWTLR